MVGQIQYLAQLGAFVPAESADISLVDRIFISIAKSDHPETGEGTYKSQLNFLRAIFSPVPKEFIKDETGYERPTDEYLGSFRNFPMVTPHSLLLFDEMAIGTDVNETRNRNLVVLKEASERGSTIYLPTHCHELCGDIATGKVSHALNLATIVAITPEGRVTYLRKLVRGQREQSYGHILAEQMGVTPETLAAGRNLKSETRRDR
jgi:DNA mismatch repair protein MutS